jgi:signal transduction histidine kinase
MQVMDNLISNAVKFSTPDTPVTVRVQRLHGQVRIAVHDCGPGVPDEFRARIFEKFAQAEPTAGGSSGCGLGLSISKGIVEHLGGRLAFQSRAGEGTVFFFDLPEWDAERAALEEGKACREEG